MTEPAIDLGEIDVRAMAEAAMPARTARVKRDRETARGRLEDRGIDPNPVIGTDAWGEPLTVAGFYVVLRRIAVTEKAGQDPTYDGSRLVLETNLPQRVKDTMFVALNQQSAEEAVHGDKVFGAAYFEMGGAAPTPYDDEGFGSGLNKPGPDKAANGDRLCDMMAAIGGIETLAMRNAFPFVLECCEKWNHPIGNALARQIQETVRPEESRHILSWRYVFREVVAERGQAAIDRYFQLSNLGRDLFVADRMPRTEFDRMMSGSTPSAEHLLGRPMPTSV